MFNNQNQSDPMTDTNKVAEAVQKVRAQIAEDVKNAVREALQERDSKYKKMLQKIISSALGIVKDPEL